MKIVYSLNKYRRFAEKDLLREWVFGDGNCSWFCSGMTGHGKDALFGAGIDTDVENGRTVFIFDTKTEYVGAAFTQNDPVLKNMLISRGLVGKSYNINIWVPYTESMAADASFNKLYQYPHPKVRIHPFRFLNKTMISTDSQTFAMGLTNLQHMAKQSRIEGGDEIRGLSKQILDFKMKAAKRHLIFDDERRDKPGCNWEYINLQEVSRNNEINVISLSFLNKYDSASNLSIAIGLISELISLAMDDTREDKEVFAIYIPEFRILQPKGVPSLEIQAKTLLHKLYTALLLMRSYNARIRINVQNLEDLPPGMWSQAKEKYIGKTENSKDLGTLSQYYGFDRQDLQLIRNLKTGYFIKLSASGRIQQRMFNVQPLSHKAREREGVYKLLKRFYEVPEAFLFETPHGLLTDLDMFIDTERGTTLELYRKRIKDYLNQQLPILKSSKPLPLPTEIQEIARKVVEDEYDESGLI
jgi:hypothetical protein